MAVVWNRSAAVRVCALVLGLLCWMAPSVAGASPDFQAVKAAYTPSDAWLLDRHGRELQQLRLDRQVRRLAWTPLEAVSPALLRALLYSEDKRFYAHAGVDWNAAAASAWRNLWNTRTRGASTLTMQLTGLLQQGAAGRGARRGVLEKTGQAIDALLLERRWQKDEILEAYLNLAGFRGELQGVAAMSWGLFGKSPAGLDEREAAVAAALLRAPNAQPGVVARRACSLLRSMQRSPECDGLEGFVALHLRGPYAVAVTERAPHLARRLLRTAGERRVSTLDFDIQASARWHLRANLMQLETRNVEDGAVLVLDNASGDVLAWVGSSGDLSGAPEFDAVTAPRQAGSTLKPFLYGLAIAQRRLTAASLLDDSPVRINTPGGIYVPQNYDKHFVGPVSLRMALGSSLNVPAVRTLLQVGPDPFHRLLRQFGFQTLRESGDYYGYSLALGSADVTLLDLTNAYRALANGGNWRPVRLQPDAALAAARPALLPAAASIVSDILADRSARVHTFGLDSALATRYWSAVKTGTSKDMRDNWCIGYSRRYTVGVWVGNAGGEPMHDVSGVSGAAPVWVAVMDDLHRAHGVLQQASAPPSPAPGIEPRAIRFEPPVEPPRREWFLQGTAQSVIRANDAARRRLEPAMPADARPLRIDYPGPGSIIALDPDIPRAQQRVLFKADVPLPAGWHWRLDGLRLQDARWFPMPGRHLLSLRDGSGSEVSSVRFEVRGASVRPPAR